MIELRSGEIATLNCADGSVVRWIPGSRSQLARLRTVIQFGRPIVFATVAVAPKSWEVRGWDVESGKGLATEGLHLRGGQRDKVMYGLAAVPISRKTIKIAFSSEYGKVMVASLTQNGMPVVPKLRTRPYVTWQMPNHSNEFVTCLEIGYTDGSLLLVSGSGLGHLVIWDMAFESVSAERDAVHNRNVNALCFGKIGRADVICSGGQDGVVRVWDLRLLQRAEIEVGEPITALA